LAAGVLSSPNTKGKKALREWSIKVINKYANSSLRIDGDLKNRLINGEASLAGLPCVAHVDNQCLSKTGCGTLNLKHNDIFYM